MIITSTKIINKSRNCETGKSRPVSQMTNEEKVKIVSSVYSNVKKLTIAQFIFNSKSCTSEQIIAATGYEPVGVSQTLSGMLEAGIITMSVNDVDRRYRIITMTELGKRIMKL